MDTTSKFQNLDFGTKPSTSALTDVKVTVQAEMVEAYSSAYIKEAKRTNPLKFETLSLTEEELNHYFLGLLQIRIDSITPEGTKDWRIAKRFWIPDFLQFSLSLIGEVTDHVNGFRFLPVANFNYEIQSMLETSSKIESLEKEGMPACQDAMPRGIKGDLETMSLIISQDYVYGRNEHLAPIKTYVAAFLGLKLQEETTFKMLFRVRYDDVAFIQNCLMNERSIFTS